MAASSSQVTTVKLDVTDAEQTGTFPGEKTTFVGSNVEKLYDIFGDAGIDMQEVFQLSSFTVGADAGVTTDYHYRRVRVPTDNVNLVIPSFFTNVQLGLTTGMFIKVQKESDTEVIYDVFVITEGVGTLTNLDLYVETNRVSDSDVIIQFPTFPNATDPVRAQSRTKAKAKNDRSVDSLFLAQP